MSMCEKHVEAIGSPRANSPSWPCIEAMPKSEAEYTCAVGTGAKEKGACNEGESIYGPSMRLPNWERFIGKKEWHFAIEIAISDLK